MYGADEAVVAASGAARGPNAPVAHAQPKFGALTGVIKDSANVPLAGATITAAQLDGSTVRAAISNSEGSLLVFRFGASDLTR